MFFLTFLRHELVRRMRQAIVISLGPAVGIGLVISVVAASGGVQRAQEKVLHALYGIGTDVTVTVAPPKPPKLGTPDAAKYAFTPGAVSRSQDLLGLPPGLGVLDASSAAQVARLDGVESAAGGLTLMNTKLVVPSLKELGPDGKPPASAIPTTSTVDGVDLGHTGLGPYASAAIGSGRTFAASDAASDVAVVDAGYAAAEHIGVGSAVVISKKRFTVIGICRQPQGGGAADVYVPLARAQALAAFQGLPNLNGHVDAVYVKASDASSIGTVRKEIAALLPAATVTSSASLADAVSGSLSSAARLAKELGRWLAIASLAAAFAVASLLTVAAVTRRVREFGTLKAMGWRSRRIVAQLMAEAVVTGFIGAALGVGIGFAGAALVRALAPDLSATVATNPGSTPPQNVSINETGMHRQIAPGSTHTIAVHLTAPVTLTTIALAVALAVAGGLIAGSFGGWRAARLRPAQALQRTG
ncbi:ABC transporter permease [Actinomadura sp. DC4]|uniref:ABC transporter permease n=1 Tax=Actinomadura sp. DC4 TaxID=3055069 RepID=UPI0025B0DB63|nr:ABC transporter permease [Actinomadura sp. DC4]MDN3356463.1 ABC transporter permease [Actinomadura sp. DC4]